MIHHQSITFVVDVVTVSHHHGDHSYVERLPGQPQILRGSVLWRVGDVEFQRIFPFHNNAESASPGPNTIFVITKESLRPCHLGDLSQVPSAEQINLRPGIRELRFDFFTRRSFMTASQDNKPFLKEKIDFGQKEGSEVLWDSKT